MSKIWKIDYWGKNSFMRNIEIELKSKFNSTWTVSIKLEKSIIITDSLICELFLHKMKIHFEVTENCLSEFYGLYKVHSSVLF